MEEEELSGEEDFVTVRDAAIFYHICEETIRRYIRQGKLPAKRIGRAYWIPKEGIRTFMARAYPHSTFPGKMRGSSVEQETSVSAGMAVTTRPVDSVISDFYTRNMPREITVTAKENDFWEVTVHRIIKDEQLIRLYIAVPGHTETIALLEYRTDREGISTSRPAVHQKEGQVPTNRFISFVRWVLKLEQEEINQGTK